MTHTPYFRIFTASSQWILVNTFELIIPPLPLRPAMYVKHWYHHVCVLEINLSREVILLEYIP